MRAGKRRPALAPMVRAGHCGRYPRGNNAAKANREKHMRTLLLVVGIVALAIGLLWIGQGTGVVKWPQSSFMISQIQWAWYGAVLAVVGLVLIWRGKR